MCKAHCMQECTECTHTPKCMMTAYRICPPVTPRRAGWPWQHPLQSPAGRAHSVIMAEVHGKTCIWCMYGQCTCIQCFYTTIIYENTIYIVHIQLYYYWVAHLVNKCVCWYNHACTTCVRVCVQKHVTYCMCCPTYVPHVLSSAWHVLQPNWCYMDKRHIMHYYTMYIQYIPQCIEYKI